MRVQLGLPPSWLRTLLEPAAETLLLPGTFVGSSLSWGNGDIALTDREGSPSPSCPGQPVTYVTTVRACQFCSSHVRLTFPGSSATVNPALLWHRRADCPRHLDSGQRSRAPG